MYSKEEIKDKKSFVRIFQLKNNPIKGNFDLEHLKKIHHFIFQDTPSIVGRLREETEKGKVWFKNRFYEGFGETTVFYGSMNLENIKELENVLANVNIENLKKLNKNDFVKTLTDLYVDVDFIHPFTDGNSRTLREFTRVLSNEVGYKLDWGKNNQQELYLARDFEVNSMFLSKITSEKEKLAIKEELKAIKHHKEYKNFESLINKSISKITIKPKEENVKANKEKKEWL